MFGDGAVYSGDDEIVISSGICTHHAMCYSMFPVPNIVVHIICMLMLGRKTVWKCCMYGYDDVMLRFMPPSPEWYFKRLCEVFGVKWCNVDINISVYHDLNHTVVTENIREE